MGFSLTRLLILHRIAPQCPQLKGWPSTVFQRSLSARIRVARSSVEVKLACVRTRLSTIEKQISICLTQAATQRRVMTFKFLAMPSIVRCCPPQGEVVLTVPPQHRSQECAVCTFRSPDNRKSPSEFVCQRCGHTDHADDNAACVIAKRGIQKLLSGDPLTKTHRRTRIFRKLGRNGPKSHLGR